jgi:hypothetical protein
MVVYATRSYGFLRCKRREPITCFIDKGKPLQIKPWLLLFARPYVTVRIIGIVAYKATFVAHIITASLQFTRQSISLVPAELGGLTLTVPRSSVRKRTTS